MIAPPGEEPEVEQVAGATAVHPGHGFAAANVAAVGMVKVAGGAAVLRWTNGKVVVGQGG